MAGEETFWRHHFHCTLMASIRSCSQKGWNPYLWCILLFLLQFCNLACLCIFSLQCLDCYLFKNYRNLINSNYLDHRDSKDCHNFLSYKNKWKESQFLDWKITSLKASIFLSGFLFDLPWSHLRRSQRSTNKLRYPDSFAFLDQVLNF